MENTLIDWSAAAATITSAPADAAPVMAALVGMGVAFMVFRRIRSLIGR